jgi:hypothetical protein
MKSKRLLPNIFPNEVTVKSSESVKLNALIETLNIGKNMKKLKKNIRIENSIIERNSNLVKNAQDCLVFWVVDVCETIIDPSKLYEKLCPSFTYLIIKISSL